MKLIHEEVSSKRNLSTSPPYAIIRRRNVISASCWSSSRFLQLKLRESERHISSFINACLLPISSHRYLQKISQHIEDTLDETSRAPLQHLLESKTGRPPSSSSIILCPPLSLFWPIKKLNDEKPKADFR